MKFDESEITGQDFRRLCSAWATGVAVITANAADDELYALTMNSVTSLSLEPPMMLICVAKSSETLPVIQAAGAFCINVLADGQQAISAQCAAKGRNKLKDVPLRSGRFGSLVIEGALVALECRLVDEYDGGDHRILVGQVVSGHETTGKPLVYYQGSYVGT